MIRGVVSYSLKFRIIVVIAAAAILTVGVAQLGDMKRDAYPEFASPYVQIQTEALGLSASEVEQLITVPLEADLLNGVAWVDKIRSQSIPGLSTITLNFEKGTNLLRARQMVSERLNTPAAIPNVSKAPIMLPPMSSTSRVMMVSLSSKDMSLIDMGVLARWTIKPRLIGVPGVANVAIWGQRERQLQVQVDPKRLHDNGVSLSQVLNTTGNSLWVSPLTFLEASTPGTGGFFDTPNQRLAIRHVSPITKASELAAVPLEPSDTAPAASTAAGGGEDQGVAAAPKPAPSLRLSDVANVVEDNQPLIGDAIVDGKPGLMLVVEKLPNANTIDVTNGVKDALDALKPGLGTLRYDTSVFEPATFMNRAIGDLRTTLLIGLGLLVLVLALFFYQWRTALVAIVAILTSVVGALLVLDLTGSTMNTLVLTGLLVGLAVVIDDGVTTAQTVARRAVEAHPAGVHAAGERPIANRVLDAVMESRRGLLFATIVILLPVLPVFFLGSVGEALGRPMVLSYGLAVLVSMAIALTVTPALSVVVFSRAPLTPRESPVRQRLQHRYGGLLSRSVGSGATAVIMFVILAALGAVLLPFLRQAPLPTFKETDFLVDLEAPAGTSLPEMDRITERASAEVQKLKGVRAVGGHVGRAITGDQISNTNKSELWVSLDKSADYDQTVASVRRTVKGYPGIDSDVKTYSEDRFANFETGTDKPIVVRVYGAELPVLRDQVQKVTAAMAGIKGLKNVDAKLPTQEPTVQVEVNLDAAKNVGVKPGDVRRAAATLVSGVTAGSLFEEQKVFDVVVWGTPATRQDVSAVRNLLIDTPNGNQVRLGDVASVDVKPSPSVINRDAVSRYIDIVADVSGRSSGAVVSDIKHKLSSVAFPLEYRYELVSNYAARQAAARQLAYIGLGIAFGTFLLMQAAFGSWRLATLSFLALPLSLVGGIVVIFLDGRDIELGSLAGLLAVFAIAVRNGVILLRRYQGLEREGTDLSGPDLVLHGARERLAAIVTTAVATAAFFAPFAFLGERPGHELVEPMARVILGGLVTSTIVALFLVPGLYARFAYGRAAPEELDLQELWEDSQAETAASPSIAGNGEHAGAHL